MVMFQAHIFSVMIATWAYHWPMQNCTLTGSLIFDGYVTHSKRSHIALTSYW